MRKIIAFNMVTLDGFFEGPNREIDWHNVDAEFNQFASEQLDTADMLLFGRVTYEMMASYWPTPTALTDDPVIAEKMNSKPKIVFSTKLEKTDWNNTRLIKENIVKELSKIKQQPGKDLFIFGSAALTDTLLQAGLVDEIRVMVNPILLGNGHPLFKNATARRNLKLLTSRMFTNGNVLLYYQPVVKEKNIWQKIQQTIRPIVKRPIRERV